MPRHARSAALEEYLELEHATLRMAAIVESSGDAIMSVGLDGIVTSWNPAAARLFGHPSEEMLGKPLSALAPPERAEAVPDLNKRISRGSHFHDYETELAGKDGRRVEVSLTISPIRSAAGRVTGAALIARDISERKEADRKFRLAIESAPNGVIMIDGEGKIALVNAKLEEIFGYGRSELLGQTVEMLVPVPLREAHVGHRTEFFAHPGTRPMGWGREVVGVRKDGTEIPLEIGLNHFVDGGRPFVLASLVDITQRKAAEAARLKSEMVAWVSHEFNNALTVLATSVHVLRESEPKRPGAVRLRAYEILERTMSRLTNTMANWLDNAKLDSGKLPVNMRKTFIRKVVKETLAAMRPLALYRNIRIRTALPLEAVPVKADADALSLVVANLISNAVKYTPEGGHIAIMVKYRDAGRVEVSVKDNGIGIAPSEIPSILSGHRTEEGKKAAKGFGIGLKICRELLLRHDSRLDVESAPGRGSRFSFTLARWDGSAGSGDHDAPGRAL